MINELQKSKDLIDDEQYELAFSVLNNLKELSPKYENLRLLFSSICLYNLEDYKLAIDFADKVLRKNEKNEFASQIKYLSYFELKEYDNALNEIISFLSKNKADLYKVTLEELLIDIKDGFINKDETISKIKELALKNNVNPNIMDF
jgi:tetratricopeptide (TPR) repeat protein